MPFNISAAQWLCSREGIPRQENSKAYIRSVSLSEHTNTKKRTKQQKNLRKQNEYSKVSFVKFNFTDNTLIQYVCVYSVSARFSRFFFVCSFVGCSGRSFSSFVYCSATVSRNKVAFIWMLLLSVSVPFMYAQWILFGILTWHACARVAQLHQPRFNITESVWIKSSLCELFESIAIVDVWKHRRRRRRRRWWWRLQNKWNLTSTKVKIQ